jgi:hypothetical protein
MAAPVALLIAVAAGGTGLGGLAPDQCSRTQTALENALESAQFQKEPESGLRRIYSEANKATQRCPAAEGVAYVLVRSAELGRGVLVGQLPINGAPELPKLTAAAAEKFPKSARILTVDARVSRDAETARRAMAADPKYIPARVALADILVQSGDWHGAEASLDNAQGLNATNDGLVVLALIKLEKGDARGAFAKANQALSGRRAEPIEPDARDPRPVARAHAVAARAALSLRRFNDAADHLVQADPRDPLVRKLVQDPPPDLAKALRARRH